MLANGKSTRGWLALLAALALGAPSPALAGPTFYVGDFGSNGVYKFNGSGANNSTALIGNFADPEKTVIIGNTLYTSHFLGSGQAQGGGITMSDKNTGAFLGTLNPTFGLGMAASIDNSYLYVASAIIVNGVSTPALDKISVATGALVSSVATIGPGSAYGVAVEANGNVLVTTNWQGGRDASNNPTFNSGVFEYDSNLNFLRAVVPVGKYTTGLNNFQMATGIAVNPVDGSFYVTQYGLLSSARPTDEIFHFDKNGNLLDTITGLTVPQLIGTFDVTFGPDGYLYATTGANTDAAGDFSVLRFDPTNDSFAGVYATNPNIGIAKSITFDPTVVPEPSSLVLLGLGLAAGAASSIFLRLREKTVGA